MNSEPITAAQIEEVRKYINEILPRAGMIGDVHAKIAAFAVKHADIEDLNDITREQTADLLELFSGYKEDFASLVRYIEEAIKAEPSGASTAIGATAVPTPQAEQREANEDLFPEIPDIFKQYDNWLTFKSKDEKAPIISGTLSHAKSNDPTTWVSYSTLLQNIGEGKGYRNVGFCPDGERTGYLTAIDIDNCVNFQTGEIAPWALRILALLGATYAEVTVSGSGLRAWAIIKRDLHTTFELGDAAKANPMKKAAQIEVVNDKQYMTFSRAVLATSVNAVRRLTDAESDAFFQLLAELQKEFPAATSGKNDKEPPRNEQGIVPKGFVHAYMVRRAGRLREMGLSADGIETVLMELVYKHCEHPIDESRVKQVAQSFGKYEEGKPHDLFLESEREGVTQQQTAQVDVSNWLSMFRSVEEMEDGPIVMLVDGVLQEGTCFVGASPSDGKTLVGLALAKAISTGTPLFGLPEYAVKEARTVIYLIPESRDRAFRKRCEAFKMPTDKMKFMARTISAGVSLELGDPCLLEAVRRTNAVVFLDTASRFMKGADENAAAQNRQLVNDVIALLAAGAVCVVLLHHATKAGKAKKEAMTLENMLRGTSDLGAMCDQAYGIRKDMTLYANGAGPMEIDLVNLKDREQIGGLTALRLAASRKVEGEGFPVSYINETGNFKVVNNAETYKRELENLVRMVKSDPNIPAKELAQQTGLTEYTVKHKLGTLGWHRVQGGQRGASPWHQDNDMPCPFAKEKRVRSEKISKPPKLGNAEAVEVTVM